jgi:hypothetical protein
LDAIPNSLVADEGALLRLKRLVGRLEYEDISNLSKNFDLEFTDGRFFIIRKQ